MVNKMFEIFSRTRTHDPPIPVGVACPRCGSSLVKTATHYRWEIPHRIEDAFELACENAACEFNDEAQDGAFVYFLGEVVQQVDLSGLLKKMRRAVERERREREGDGDDGNQNT